MCFLILVSQLILIICIIGPDTQGFQVGGFTGTRGDPNDWTTYEKNWWYHNKYSTHDWIGDAALDLVVKFDDWVGNDELRFWSPTRRLIFLIGTEVPDAPAKDLSLTLDGIIVSGQKLNSHLNFYPSNHSTRRMEPQRADSIMDILDIWHERIKNSLENGDCDIAAFYMGAISHLIADWCQWTHLIENGPYFHRDYEDTIAGMTSDYDDRNSNNGVFKYPETISFRAIPAITCLFEAAFETRWDAKAHNSEYFVGVPPSITPGSHNADNIYSEFDKSTVIMRNIKSWPAWLFDTIHHHLQLAVEYTAHMIYTYRPIWNGKCNSCGSSSKSPDQSKTLSIYGTLALWLVLFGLADVMLMPMLQVIILYLQARQQLAGVI